MIRNTNHKNSNWNSRQPFKRPTMRRPTQKIVPIQSRPAKHSAVSDMPDLAVILADLKKILHEDGLLPQHKH